MPLGLSGSGLITGFDPTASGFGKVLQVVSGSTTSSTSVASTTYTDTGLSASITPNKTNSKILVVAFQHFIARRSSNEQGHALRLLRGSTAIFSPDPNGYDSNYMQIFGATGISFLARSPIIYLDSPATTAATTYKIQGRVLFTTNSGNVTYQELNAESTMILIEVAQ